jgi:hypothetical protein
MIRTATKVRLSFLFSLQVMLMVYYFTCIPAYVLFNFSFQEELESQTYARYVISGWSLHFVGNCCYYIAHWVFSWKYWMVSSLML